MAQKRGKPRGRKPAAATPVIDLTAEEVAGDETVPAAAETAAEAGEAAAGNSDGDAKPAAGAEAATSADEPAAGDSEAGEAAQQPADDEPAQPVPPAPVRGSSGGGAGRIAATVAVALLAGAAGAWLFGEYAGQSGNGAALQGLQARIGDLEKTAAANAGRIGEVQDAVAGLRIPDVGAIEARLAEVAQQEQAAIAAGERAAGRLDELTGRIDGLDSGLGEISAAVTALKTALDKAAAEGGGATAAANEVAVSGLASRIDGLEKVIAGIDRGPDKAQTAALEALAARLTALQQEVARAANEEAARQTEDAARQAALGSTFTALSGKAGSGAPYAAELAELEAIVGASGPTARLKAFAETGIPDNEALLAELAAIDLKAEEAAAPASSEPQAGEGAAGIAGTAGEVASSVWSGVKERFFRVVKIRSKSRADWTKALDEAKVQLEAGSLDNALSRLAAVPHQPPASVAAWLERANAVKGARLALQDLSGMVVERLTGSNG